MPTFTNMAALPWSGYGLFLRIVLIVGIDSRGSINALSSAIEGHFP